MPATTLNCSEEKALDLRQSSLKSWWHKIEVYGERNLSRAAAILIGSGTLPI